MRPSPPPLHPKYLPAAKGLGFCRVSGLRSRRALRNLRNFFPTSRETTRLSRGKGWGKRSSAEKVPATSEGTKAPPRRSFGTRGRFGVVEKGEMPRKRFEACRWRVRGGVAPAASAGRLALHDLSPEATGRAAESEGGSSGHGELRHACPCGLRGKLQPDPAKRLPPTPNAGQGPEGTLAFSRVGSIYPRGPGQPPGTLCCWPPLQGVRIVALGLILEPVPHPNPLWPRRCGPPRWREPTAARRPVFPRPWMHPRWKVDPLSYLPHKHFSIHPLLIPGGH